MANVLSYSLFWQCPSEFCHKAKAYFGNQVSEVWRIPKAGQTITRSSPARGMLNPRAWSRILRCWLPWLPSCSPNHSRRAAWHCSARRYSAAATSKLDFGRAPEGSSLSDLWQQPVQPASPPALHSGHRSLWASAVLQGQGNLLTPKIYLQFACSVGWRTKQQVMAAGSCSAESMTMVLPSQRWPVVVQSTWRIWGKGSANPSPLFDMRVCPTSAISAAMLLAQISSDFPGKCRQLRCSWYTAHIRWKLIPAALHMGICMLQI